MSDLASIPLLQSIGWALLHSLWQGTLLALVAALALRLTRRHSPDLRHFLALATLGLLVLAFLVTLVWVSTAGNPLSVAGAGLMAPVGEAVTLSGWLPRLRDALIPWIPWLFLAWMLGFSFRLVGIGRGLAWLYGPCLKGLKPPPAEWMARFEALRVRGRVRVSVRLGLSEQVDSLLVLGWLKPVVVVPAAALLNLSPVALEALMAHELAHVRRGDFLANLGQAFAEALLFYHPAVWWLSRRIRQEREHCCDDAAVQTCGDPILYASALAGLEELRTSPHPFPDLATAASGGNLVIRIQRLLRPRLTQTPTSLLAALLPILLAVATVGLASLSCSSPAKIPAAGPVDMDFSRIHIRHQPDPPAYPPDAKAARIQGTVEVVIVIGVDGKVIEAKALSGPPELQTCAVDYAKGWEFEPAMVNGKPVPARFKLTMPFRLR